MLHCSTKTAQTQLCQPFGYRELARWELVSGRVLASTQTRQYFLCVVVCLRCQQREPRTLRPSVQTTRRPSRHCRHCFVSELISNISQRPLLKESQAHGIAGQGMCILGPSGIMTASTFVMMMATTLRPNVDSLSL